MKKLIALLLSMVCAAGTMVSCGKADDGFDGILTHNYNYDLSEYIDLAEYKGLPAEGYRYEVTDEMVEEQILSTRSFYSRLTDVERGAQIGKWISRQVLPIRWVVLIGGILCVLLMGVWGSGFDEASFIYYQF